ncbi:Uncharacterised protein [Sphingobacterium spiritivorum]|uniref:HipA-like kinase domain-containing protein n=1 Tax=Sphingobacterium spiritivorum TaxID=258 RepID=A0A380CV54_SPHSI|nr:HipA family kinase [Sphingobacterium spiritivorum]SUJ28688.1 Uncharacterised protein [Sphingobacterium spiritivorum]
MKSAEVTSLIKKMEGGSTEPILISTIDAQGIEGSYVLKLYKEDYELQAYTTFKEVVVNYLINEFDLRTPEIALVHISDSLALANRSRFNQFKNQTRKEFDFSKRKVAFEYLSAQSVGFNDNFDLDITDYSTIYAFDFLILNNDRGGLNKKSNLLIDENGFILIDHEICFYFINSQNTDDYNQGHSVIFSELDDSVDNTALEMLKTSLLEKRTLYNYSTHIFHEKLRQLSAKQNLFDDFFYYLEELSVIRFEKFIKSLDKYDLQCPSGYLLVEYLRFIKDNMQNFKDSLYTSIK